MNKFVLALIFSLITMFSCAEDDDNNDTNNTDGNSFSISGTLDIKEDFEIPEGAVLKCFWHVINDDLEPDGYVWNDGEFDKETGTFSIYFENIPKYETIYRSRISKDNSDSIGIGIAYIVLLSEDVEGYLYREDRESFESKIIGLISDRAVIYKENSNTADFLDWFNNLSVGYNMCKGKYNEEESFDDWIITDDKDSLILIVNPDDDDFEFPNWT